MKKLALPGSNLDPARDNWYRYQYMRDEGHIEFVDQARICEDFVAGIQWDEADLRLLKQSGRPAMTINKILSTVDHLSGEQLFNRSDISFRPARGGANAEVADALTKVHMSIAQINQLSWVRSDVFCDGIVTGRGFFDIRIDANSNFMGDVVIKRLQPKLVLLDPDAQEYDPKTWSDVGRSAWMNLQEIELLYGKKIANELAPIPSGYAPYDFADDDYVQDGTFASGARGRRNHSGQSAYMDKLDKYYRVFERQYYELVQSNVFVDTIHGEIVPVPQPWDDERIGNFMQSNPQVVVMRKPMRKIRWTTSAGAITLHDSWSPYDYFTPIPFFPHFREGRTHGVVQHLIGPQQGLNKTRSQELHVVNTSANSGWVVTKNNLVTMTEQQLESHGSKTGVVITVNDIAGIEKIKPNQIPQGLDRISYKNEEDMKNISGVSDAMTGFAREDVSGKALKANQAVGSTSFAPLFDNLARTDFLLAQRSLKLIQTFYTEPRLLHIMGTKPGQQDQTVMVNQITPEGEILNDLSIGEYSVVVTNEPDRDSYNESQFDHAVTMRQELGIPIPDEYIIRVSKLRDKEEIISAMSPKDPAKEQFDREVQQGMQVAELEKLRAEAQDRKADALLKSVRAANEKLKAEIEAANGGEEGEDPQAQLAIQTKVELLKENQRHQHELEKLDKQAVIDQELKEREHMNNMVEIREQHFLDVRAERLKPKPEKAPAARKE